MLLPQKSSGGLAHALATSNRNLLVKTGLESVDAYDPSELLDAVASRMHLADDEGLARQLKVAPPIIPLIRRRKIAISSASMLIWMHEETGLSIYELRNMMRLA